MYKSVILATLLASASAFAPITTPTTTRSFSTSLFGEIEDSVKEVVVEQLGCDEAAVKPDATFASDLGADSLDAVELIMAIEERFEIEIPDDEAEKITTVQAAVDYVKSAQA